MRCVQECAGVTAGMKGDLEDADKHNFVARDVGVLEAAPRHHPLLRRKDLVHTTTLEATQGQMNTFFSQLPYECHLFRWHLWEIDLRFTLNLTHGR